MKSVCVFTGSNRGHNPAHAEAARRLAGELVARGIGLVYGGSRGGLMGIIADAVLAGGGAVTGVIPTALVSKELLHPGLTRTHIVESMHERKARFAELADGFVAMPGGLGTLEELFEVLTWAQLGFHAKPVGLLDSDGYFGQLRGFLAHCVSEGFLSPAHREILLVHDGPAALLDAMSDYRAVPTGKWIDDAGEL